VGVNPPGPLAPECRKAAQKGAKLCASLGHRVEDVTERFQKDIPWAELWSAWGVLDEVANMAWASGRLDVLKRDLRNDDVEPVMRECLERSRRHTGLDLAKARAAIFRASRIVAEFQRDHDVILTPTLGNRPGEHRRMHASGSYESFGQGHYAFIPFTPLANWTGQPAMSVPLYWMADGLPIGVHFLGRFGDEATLFRLAAQLEKAQPWWEKRPQI